MKSKQKKPSLAAQRIRLAISVAQRRRHGRAATNAPSTSGSHQLTVSPRQSIASPRRRKLASHSNAPSTSRSQQSVESPSPPHTITASRRLHVTPSNFVEMITSISLYWKEDAKKKKCDICGHARFKKGRKERGKDKEVPYKVLRYLPLTPRLQRLFMSSKYAEHMSWHKKGRPEGVLTHPSDGEVWKHLDRSDPSFAEDARNVRLGLSTDGFNPFGHSSRPYSCWPVFVTPYNLPPWMYMKEGVIFLTLIIPGPHSPGKNIDVYLRPLIEELKILWKKDGVPTYDVSTEQNFQMRAALLWTINDFPAYENEEEFEEEESEEDEDDFELSDSDDDSDDEKDSEAMSANSSMFEGDLSTMVAEGEVRGGSQYYGSRGRGVHRATKPDRVTRNQSTTTQSHHSMSPIADSSRVFEASEEVPDTRDQESSTRKRGPRGANLNKNILANSSQRKVIHISGLNYLEHEVVRAITKDFKALFYGEETQWHKLDKDLVEIFYKSFQDRYQYEDNVDPETARLVWEERAKLRFSDLWVLVRKHCKKKTEKWKKRSAAGVANRKKVPGDEDGSYVRHTGGCVSFEIHRTRWETELGIEMTDIEFFEKLHKKDKGKGTWCDLRAERAAAKYREIVMKKNGADDLADIPFDDEAWAEATCFTKNNKGYGFGLTKQAESICRKAKRTKRLRAYNSRRIDEAWIESEVADRVEKRMEAFQADMQQRVQEQVQVQVQVQVEKFLAGLQNQAPTYW
ncbi:retrovirus-related pol polyprotein from transposon TNT 1-94 [Tanacetum coccineum]